MESAFGSLLAVLVGCSGFGGDDFAVFPGEQGQVPAFVFGAEFLGHGFGGGMAAGNKRGLLTGGS